MHPLTSQFRGPFMRMEKADDDAAAAAAAAEKEKADADAAAAAEAEKNKPKPGSAEHRVQEALRQKKEAEDKLTAAEQREAERARKDKEREEKELAEKGEFKTLAEQRATEAAAEKEKRESAEKELGEARKEAEEEVKAAVDKIADEKKRATVQELLSGKSPFEQRRLLPKIFDMAGLAAPGRVGAGLPGEGAQGGSKAEEKEKEYRDLLAKSQKGEITPAERGKLNTLGRELRDLREAARKKETKQDDGDPDAEVTLH